MAKTIVGLEVTEESVRGAELSSGRAPQLLAYGEVALPPEAARDSEVLDAGIVATALRELWVGARFTSRDVVLGVASRRILVREYTTQAMRPDLLREALPYQVQDLLPVPASEAVLDFYPLSQEGDQVSGLLVAAISETIERIIGTLSTVKVRAQAVDLGAFGLARATASLSAADETVATVHIGDHTTQVVLARGGIPQFVRLLPIDVPTAASRRHALAPAEAQADFEFVSTHGPLADAPTRSGIRAAMPPGVSDLAARLRSTLAFFASRPHAGVPTRVFVTGAGANVEGMMSALSSAIDLPMRVVSVADVIPMSTPLPAEDVGLNLVGTVGIALAGVAR